MAVDWKTVSREPREFAFQYTYGYATRAIVHGLCGGDVARFQEFKARFSDVVFPGETLTTEGWRGSTGRYIIRARTERAVVLSNAYAAIIT